jgi:P-aminobenzoate N-oxygenase AurF
MAKQPPQTLDCEVRETATGNDSYAAVLDRLSKASVDRHWEPYLDIPWEDPEYRIDPDDPRWKLAEIDRLGAHPWYKAQPPAVQSRIGLWRVATAMKIGMQFENLLKRGLLA